MILSVFTFYNLTAIVSSNYNAAQVSCNGASDAEATANALGGIGIISYLWSDGQTTAIVSGLGAGNYTVTATDANTCSVTASLTVIEPTILAVTAIVQNASCLLSSGSINITTTGGTSPYSYLVKCSY